MKRNSLAEKQCEFMMKILDKQTEQNDAIFKLLKGRHRGPSNDTKPSANNSVASKSDVDGFLCNGNENHDFEEYDIKNNLGWIPKLRRRIL